MRFGKSLSDSGVVEKLQKKLVLIAGNCQFTQIRISIYISRSLKPDLVSRKSGVYNDVKCSLLARVLRFHLQLLERTGGKTLVIRAAESN